MSFTWVIQLLACTPAEPAPEEPSLPDAEVQRPRLVGCEMAATGEYAAGEAWVPYLWRERSYDDWGNVAFDHLEDEQGGRFELSVTWRGRWQLERTLLDTFGSPVTNEAETWSWDGNFLKERSSVRNGEASVSSYRSNGVNPYDRADVDVGDDGSVDLVVRFTWSADRIVFEEENEGDDASAERSWRYAYDAEGHLLTREYDEDSGAYDHLEQTWGGPADNLLTARREVSDGVAVPTVTFQQLEWSEDWRTSTNEVFVDGLQFEIDTTTYDEAGRLLTSQRDFPSGQYTSVREIWEWDCP